MASILNVDAIVSQKRSRSVVWNYFEKLDIEGRAKCLLCKLIIKHSSNTSNLAKHLKCKHPPEHKIVETRKKEDEESRKIQKPPAQSVQLTLHQAFDQSQKYTSTCPRQKRLDNALVEMVATDMQPSTIVEDKGFKKFVYLLDPKYQLPSRRNLMRKMPEKYDEIKETVKNKLNPASAVCLTTDIWTSRTTQGYMTVTCHFIDESWQLKAFVLETFHLSVSHTAENIAAELIRIAKEWDVSEKVVALVTDNAANAVAAARITGWTHIPCFAHNLNLIVKGALSADPSLVALKKKCKDIVTFFHHSGKASDKLREIQKQLEVSEKKLIQDVDTRWNSTFYMLERILEQHDAVTTTLCLQSKSEMCLIDEDLKLIKEALDILRPFEVATAEMSADKYVSVSKVIPIARSLQRVTVGSSTTIPLKKELLSQMNRRFLNIEANLPLAKSTILDPRFQKLAFRNNGERQGVQSLVQELATIPSSEDVQEQSVATDAPASDLLWGEFDSKVVSSVSTSVSGAMETSEYFKEQLIPRKSEPLTWWQKHEKKYPKLSKLAQKYLCITATSVPSERLFSKAGELVSHKRSCLKPTNVNMLLFLNQNS